jgi:hypothetical protein
MTSPWHIPKKPGPVDFYEVHLLGGSWVNYAYYPLVNIQKDIENGHRNSGFTL